MALLAYAAVGLWKQDLPGLRACPPHLEIGPGASQNLVGKRPRSTLAAVGGACGVRASAEGAIVRPGIAPPPSGCGCSGVGLAPSSLASTCWQALSSRAAQPVRSHHNCLFADLSISSRYIFDYGSIHLVARGRDVVFVLER